MRSTFAGPVSGLLLSLLAAGAAHAQIAPCPGMTVVAPPALPDGASLEMIAVPANPASCVVGIKLEADPGVTLWRCVVEYADDAEPADPWLNAVLIMPEGQPVQSYRDDAMLGSLENMRVVKADLDGDGSAERVVALWNTTSNGLGVSSWTLQVFSGDWRPITTFEDVKEWGRSSVVAAPAGRKGCDLAITQWVDSVDKKGRGGISLEAGFQQLSGGRMALASDRPALQRRYTYAFQRERDATLERDNAGEGDVAKWLSHPSAKRVP